MTKTDTVALIEVVTNQKKQISALESDKRSLERKLRQALSNLKRQEDQVEWERDRRMDLEGTVEAMQDRLYAAGLSRKRGRTIH